MSIFGSLTTGIAGLQAQSTALGHISDNIANSQTTGYKRVDTAFNSLVLQSNSQVHNPGGVIARPNFANNVAGNIQTVDRTTNLAIRGQGFFSVSRLTEVNGRAVPLEERFYTRDGSFELDNRRILVNKSGYALNGFIYNEATGSFSTSASPVQVTADVDAPVPTRNIELRANLPTNPTPGQPVQPTTIDIFDASGTPRTITLGWRPGQVKDSWRLTIDAPGARGSLPLAGNLPGFPVSNTSTSLTQGRYDRAQIEEVVFNAPAGSSIKIGDTYRVNVNGVEFAETISVSNAGRIANLTGVAQALADKINGAVPPAGVTAIVQNGRLRITSSAPGTPFSVETSVSNAVPTANSVPTSYTTTPATTSSVQQSSITFAGSSVDIGDRYEISVNNGSQRTYVVDVTAANIGQLRDLNGVVAALAAQVNANSGTDNVVATVSGNTLTMRGTVANDSFDVGQATGLTTQEAAAGVPQITRLAYPDRASRVGDVFSVTINGTTVSRTLSAADVAAQPTINAALANLFVADINASGVLGPVVTATATGGVLTITADVNNTPFTVSARDSLQAPRIQNAPAADNTTFVSTVQGNTAGSPQTQRLSLSGVPGDVGAVYAVTIRSPTQIQDTPATGVGRLTQQARPACRRSRA